MSYTLLLSVIEFKTLVLRGDAASAFGLLPSIPKEQFNNVARWVGAGLGLWAGLVLGWVGAGLGWVGVWLGGVEGLAGMGLGEGAAAQHPQGAV